jgi:hypothetical protein
MVTRWFNFISLIEYFNRNVIQFLITFTHLSNRELTLYYMVL